MVNTPHDPDDAALLAAIRAGDESACEALIRRLGGRMLSVARRFLSNDADAQDCVQDAFLNAFRSLDRFDGRSRLDTWLHRIVVNAALMKLRGQKRRPECSLDELLPTFLADGHQQSPAARWQESGPALLERAEIRSIVRQKIGELPESHRAVLLLRDIEGHDADTVAHMLDVSPAVVKVRLHRARQALRTLLEPVFGSARP